MTRLAIGVLVWLLAAAPAWAQTAAPCPARPDDQPNTGDRRITYSTGTSANRATRQAQLERDGRTVTGYTGNGATTVIGSCAGSGTTPTPGDCVVSEWSAWIPTSEWSPIVCSAGSTQTREEQRTRTIVTPPTGGGAACGPLVETRTATRPCETTPPPEANLIFESGWERTQELGCNKQTLNLLDNKAWNDYGGSGACDGTVHDADLVDDVTADGGKSLRVNQKSGNQNGTDFRIIKIFGAQTEITATIKVRYSESWRWAGGDHKIVLFTDAAGAAQNVYINWRGGRDATHGRIAVHVIPMDVVFTDPAPQATVGRWYRIRTHLIAGTSGKVEVWLTDCGANGSDAACNAVPEVKLALVREAGGQADPNRLNTGQLGGIKPDTTYNEGSNVPPSGFQQWYDSVRVYRGFVAPLLTAPEATTSSSGKTWWVVLLLVLVLGGGAVYLFKRRTAPQ